MPLAVLVGRLDGTTLCLRGEGPTMSVSTLMAAIHDAEGIPPETQRLVCGCKDLRPTDTLAGPLPRVTLCLRVGGGKGGFGAMLRGKGLAAGQKKTTNFDACRDLNGVRLKAVHQERALNDWKSKQGSKARDKEAAPPAAARVTPAARAAPAFDLDGYYEANDDARAAVASAVADGLKRKAEEEEEAEAEAAEAVGHAQAGAGASGRARKAPRVDAPAAAPCAGASRWSVLDEPSADDDDSSDSADAPAQRGGGKRSSGRAKHE
jgi:hypothetical protein